MGGGYTAAKGEGLMEKRVTVSNGAIGNVFGFIKNRIPSGQVTISYEPVPDDLKTEKDTEQIVFTFEK